MSKKIDGLLDFWLKNNMNVMLIGEAGYGKTEMVRAAMDRNGVNWRYFSASTMDPWVDFVGVPKEKVDENGRSYLDLIRPKDFENDEVEAIFFDEFNRSPKKVRNAVMELIQFKSINGRKFHNLRVVWTAINPYDEEETYDVEKLDPAQMDRFHIQFPVPSRPDQDYFINRFGEEIGKIGLNWWGDLDKESKAFVSARRLQYILDCYMIDGDIRHMVPKSVNIGKLLLELASGSIIDKLNQLLVANNEEGLRKFLKNENHWTVAFGMLKHDKTALAVLAPYLDDERLMTIVAECPEGLAYLVKAENVDKHAPLLLALLKAKTLGKSEEATVRDILSRRSFVVDGQDGSYPVFVPTPTKMSSITFYAELSNTVRRTTTSNRFDQTVRRQTYDLIANNTSTPNAPSDALDALCLLYRLVQNSQRRTIDGSYTMIVPLINYMLDYLKNSGVNVNDPVHVAMHKKGNRKLENAVKVQKWLDDNYEKFIVKPKVF